MCYYFAMKYSLITGYIRLHGETKNAKTKRNPSMRKISKVRKKLRIVGHLGQEFPEVTLMEMKGCFRHGSEKLPLQISSEIKW